MEENLKEPSQNFIKILNKEKVLEFKLNQKSGFEESEIIIQNISEGIVLSKIYINNFKNFKCNPNVLSLSKNSTIRIKVTKVNKDYEISNSDVFLIISYQPENSKEIFDEKKINEIFKNNEIKEKGQKIYLIGYKEHEKNEEKTKDDLVKKIKELEKEVFEGEEKDKDKVTKAEEKRNEKRKDSYFIYFVFFCFFVFIVNFFVMKYLNKK